MVNRLSALPNELIGEISSYLDSHTKREFSMMDRRIHAVVLSAIRDIAIFSRRRYMSDRLPSNIPEDILVKVIRRYRALEKITFGSLHLDFHELGPQELPQLKSLLSYLQSNPEKHPLSSVKQITYKEIDFGRSSFNNHEEMNKSLLSSLCHNELEKLHVRVRTYGSVLAGAEMQPILTNSPNLKSFVLDGYDTQRTVDLSFASQPQLSEVKLLAWTGHPSTIESLKYCENLEKLVINYKGLFHTRYCCHDIKAILLKEHPWNLKHLELKGIYLQHDEELDTLTRTSPNLEYLSIDDLNHISDEGMELLGRNCPKLKTLEFKNRNITNSGLDRLTKHLPLLENIRLSPACQITEDGISAIARNCKNLRYIAVIHSKRIEQAGIDALIENCPHLRVVNFSCSGLISLEGMHSLAEQMPNLRYICLSSSPNVQEKQIQEFYQKFPRVISHGLSIEDFPLL